MSTSVRSSFASTNLYVLNCKESNTPPTKTTIQMLCKQVASIKTKVHVPTRHIPTTNTSFASGIQKRPNRLTDNNVCLYKPNVLIIQCVQSQDNRTAGGRVKGLEMIAHFYFHVHYGLHAGKSHRKN